MQKQKDIFEYLEVRKSKTPDKAYFEQMAIDVLSQHSVKIVPIYRRPIAVLSAVAAAVILVFVLINFNSTENIETNPLTALNDLPSQDLISYVDENIDDFDSELIAEYIPIDNIETDYPIEVIDEYEISNQDLSEAISFENVSNDDILEYLENEEIDIYDLEDDEIII